MSVVREGDGVGLEEVTWLDCVCVGRGGGTGASSEGRFITKACLIPFPSLLLSGTAKIFLCDIELHSQGALNRVHLPSPRLSAKEAHNNYLLFRNETKRNETKWVI